MRARHTITLAAAIAVGTITATAAPAGASTGPVVISDPHANLNICANPGPCHPALKLYDDRGRLTMLCTTTVCYRALALHDKNGWYVFLVGGGRAGPIPRKP